MCLCSVRPKCPEEHINAPSLHLSCSLFVKMPCELRDVLYAAYKGDTREIAMLRALLLQKIMYKDHMCCALFQSFPQRLEITQALCHVVLCPF
jgi:hypothetical protein